MIKRCPITYHPISEEQDYSAEGLKLLSPKLEELKPLPFSSQELRREEGDLRLLFSFVSPRRAVRRVAKRHASGRP